MRACKLSIELEYCALYAVMQGLVPLEGVTADELSKEGALVLEAVHKFAKTHPAPYAVRSVYLMARDGLGGDGDVLRSYLQCLNREISGKEIEEVLQTVRDRQYLIGLVNLATDQLAKGKLNVTDLATHITTGSYKSVLRSGADLIQNGKLPDPPRGIPIPSLPAITKATVGVFGLWAIAGGPGVGKTTLALQIAVSVGLNEPVLYYDFENGSDVLLYHLAQVFRGNIGKIRKALQRVYFRESIRTLESDLAAVGSPALIIIDSVQKLPTSVDNRRTSLDRWVHRLEALKKRGYQVLLISEKGRAEYNTATIKGFKETGEIEYSADMGMQLLETDSGRVEVHIVKNRHKKERGYLCDLTRQNDWWFQEQAARMNQNA